MSANVVYTASARGGGFWVMRRDIDSSLYGVAVVPADYSSGGAIIVAVAANAIAGATRLQVRSKPVAAGGALSTEGFVAEAAQTVTLPNTAWNLHYATFSLTPTLAAGDLLLVEVIHNGEHAADSLAVDTLIFGAWLQVTVA